MNDLKNIGADCAIPRPGSPESDYCFKRLLSSITDYIYTVKVDSGSSIETIHSPACATITGYTEDEFKTDSDLWFQMICEEDRPMVLAHIKRVLNGETPPPLEHRILHKNGTVRWIRNNCVPYKNAQGKVVAYDGLISDITERKQADEELKKAYAKLARSDATLRKTWEDLKASHEQLKATQLQVIQAAKLESIVTLAAGVAHEVKNPLQTILMGLAYLTNNLPSGDSNIQMVLTDMGDAVKRAHSIIRELLHLSAATKLELKTEDFNAVVEQSLELLHYQVVAAKINVVRKLSPDLPQLTLDKNKMEQVFVNLFTNAIYAMSPGGTLTVTTRTEPAKETPTRKGHAASPLKSSPAIIIAEVQDTGHGILEKHMPKIFDPFFTTKPTGVGAGLGLSVVKQIVDLHGGTIEIKNAAEGGIRVTLRFKAEPEQPY